MYPSEGVTHSDFIAENDQVKFRKVMSENVIVTRLDFIGIKWSGIIL